MKKIIERSIIAILMLTAISTYAGEKTDYILKIATGNGKMVSYTFNSEELSFSIYDQKHNLVYLGTSPAGKLEISKTISLENHPSGVYFLEVKENGKIIKHKIKVASKKEKTVKIDESVNESPSLRR